MIGAERPWRAWNMSCSRGVGLRDDFVILEPPRKNPVSKLLYASTALIFALSASVASAQTPQPLPPPAAPGPAAKVLPSVPSDAMTVTRWHKQNVYDPSDAKIGAVEDVLVDRDGKIVAFIVAVGGFLGMGEKDVAVPFNAVQFKTKDNNKFYPVMNTTKDALKNAPGHKYDRNAMTWTVDNAPTTTGTPATPSPQPSAR